MKNLTAGLCGLLGAKGAFHGSPDIVIPSEARDLLFAAKLQIPRFARDDNS